MSLFGNDFIYAGFPQIKECAPNDYKTYRAWSNETSALFNDVNNNNPLDIKNQMLIKNKQNLASICSSNTQHKICSSNTQHKSKTKNKCLSKGSPCLSKGLPCLSIK